MSTGHAADAPSFGSLLQQAQVNAPQLLEQAANVRAASADMRQAGVWLNPALNAVSENIGASQGGVSQREDTVSVTQAFEIGGKRAARVEAGQRRSVAASALERQTRVGFANDLAIAYATAEAMQQRQAVAQAELTRARDDLRAADALVKAGREANLRLAQARAGAAAAEAAVETASAELTGALERLGALAGAPEPYTRIVHPLLGTAPRQLPVAQWIPDDAPALATATAERDALNALIRIEQKRVLPDLGVTLGMRRFASTDQKAATIGVSLTIPLFDRNKDGIDAARERANSAAMRMETTRLNAVAAHRSAVAQVGAAERRLQAAEQGEAAALEAYRLGRIGYDAGKTALLELLAIRRQLSEATERTIAARLERVRAIATLSMAEGRIAFGEAP
ncbi:MAG: TolC family protein [Bdellovibrionales bacterium]|nr:TolC family protein [Massilia sp.]